MLLAGLPQKPTLRQRLLGCDLGGVPGVRACEEEGSRGWAEGVGQLSITSDVRLAGTAISVSHWKRAASWVSGSLWAVPEEADSSRCLPPVLPTGGTARPPLTSKSGMHLALHCMETRKGRVMFPSESRTARPGTDPPHLQGSRSKGTSDGQQTVWGLLWAAQGRWEHGGQGSVCPPSSAAGGSPVLARQVSRGWRVAGTGGRPWRGRERRTQHPRIAGLRRL